MLDWLDSGHVFLYFVGVVFLIFEGMPAYLERDPDFSVEQAYTFLLKALFWPMVAVWLLGARVVEDLRE